LKSILPIVLLLAGACAFAQTSHGTDAQIKPDPNAPKTGSAVMPADNAGSSPATDQAEHPGEPAQMAANPSNPSEEHEEGLPNAIWWKWANFAILVGVIAWLAHKKAPNFFVDRTAEIQKGISEASAIRAEAEARAAAMEQRIANLSIEVESIRKNAREEMEAEGARIRAQTAAEIAKIQALAEQEIASAAKHATRDLKSYSAELALHVAEQKIQSRMNPQQQSALVDLFIQDLNTKEEAAVN
jgi:F-type H+-transporting ATPase subunit b